MDLAWIDVGSEMSMRAMAALVASFSGISGNTWLLSAARSAWPVVAAFKSRTGSRSDTGWSSRRFMKQGRQYTGLSRLGLNGTVVDFLQSAQTTS